MFNEAHINWQKKLLEEAGFLDEGVSPRLAKMLKADAKKIKENVPALKDYRVGVSGEFGEDVQISFRKSGKDEVHLMMSDGDSMVKIGKKTKNFKGNKFIFDAIEYLNKEL